MTYWLPFLWMFGPPLVGLAAVLMRAQAGRSVFWLLTVPFLWAIPLWGTLAVTHGGAAHALYVAALWALLAGWAVQVGLCVMAGVRGRAPWLAAAVFLLNLPASGMALLGLGQGVAGVSM